MSEATATRSIHGAAPFANKDSTFPFLLLHADFCPFDARAWMSLLEKEADPHNPNLFENVHVFYLVGPKRDKGTEMLYSLNIYEVPVLINNKNSQVVSESMLIAQYVDELFPDINPLQPSDPLDKHNMRLFIDRYNSLSGLFYGFLLRQDKQEQEKIRDKLRKLMAKLEKDLQFIPGPYLCGDQFTLADIHIFPFMERVKVVLSHYRGFTIPEEFVHIHQWYEKCASRPSVQITCADRNDESMKAYFYLIGRTRTEFLIETYEFYAHDEVGLAKEIFKNSESPPGVNPYAEYKKKQRDGTKRLKVEEPK